MRKLLTVAAVLALTLAFSAAPAKADSFNFSSNSGTGITFSGGSFSFPSGFNITSQNFGGGFLVGLMGSISGTYAIGAITISGPVQSAPVSGFGTFTIDDGLGFSFTATVSWIDISTLGAGGSINSSANINLTNLSYGGANADLLTLLSNNSSGLAVISFQFDSQKTLTELKSSTGISTSYSGSATVPEPGTLALFGTALLGLAGLRRKLS